MNRPLFIAAVLVLSSGACSARPEQSAGSLSPELRPGETRSDTAATSGPFARVPAGEWPYATVRQLVAAGYFTGYPAPTFADGRGLTRFDFAVALQRMEEQAEKRASALTHNGGSTEAGNLHAPDATAGCASLLTELKLLQRLAQEFSSEIFSLGQDPEQLRAQLRNLVERIEHLRADSGAGLASHPPAARGLASPRGSALWQATGPFLSDPVAGVDRGSARYGLASLPVGLLPANPGAGGAQESGYPAFGFNVNVARSDRAGPAGVRLPLAESQESTAMDARLTLPLGRALVSGFYKRIGEQFRGGDAWMPRRFRGLQGMQGLGGAVSAPVGNLMSLDLEGGALRDAAGEPFSGVLFVRSGIRFSIGREFTLGVGYERLQFGSGLAATDIAEQYNIGVGHAFTRNARLELLYQFSNLRRGLDGDPSSLSDTHTYSAVTQFKIRF